jgi:hypothetical protein
MKKFEGWMTSELQFLATLMAGRAMEVEESAMHLHLYPELIREIRNRRVKEELFQMKLEVTEEE